MRVMLWFRTDLRTGDHAALAAATREATRGVVGVFVISPAQWTKHDWGRPKVDFVLRAVAALRKDLEALHIPLRIVTADRFEDVPAALLALAAETECDALFYSKELEINEVNRDRDVADTFADNNLHVRTFDDACVLPPGDVRTREDGWYTVFSPFRKRFGEVWDERGGVEPAPAPRRQTDMPCPSDDIPFTNGTTPLPNLSELWPAGEDHARARLDRFLESKVETYLEARDFPADPATSALSPYLAAGVISPRECVRATLRAAGLDALRVTKHKTGPTHWISEVLWREFYKHLLVGYPHLCKGRNFRPEFDALPWREDPEGLDAWRQGRTGIPIVDAAMRQLLQTGWMHNRSRMISAMFLTKNLLIDWRHGERHFMHHLVDADLASNNGGWQWSASTGTDAAPYFRIFNPVRQSNQFDAQGEYIRRFVPELAQLSDDEIHDPPPLARAGLDYPEPIVDLKTSRARAIRVFEEARGG